MPTYFFHITEGDEVMSDPEGVELADFAAARTMAIDGARSLIADAVREGAADYGGRLDVADDRGRTVFALTFACSIAIATVTPEAVTSGSVTPEAVTSGLDVTPPVRRPGGDTPA